MSNFYIVLRRDNDILFDTIKEAHEHASKMGLFPDNFMVLQHRHAKNPPENYSVFSHRQWRGGCWESIDAAIEYAKSIGLVEFAVYVNVKANKLSDAVYMTDEKGEVEYDARNE